MKVTDVLRALAHLLELDNDQKVIDPQKTYDGDAHYLVYMVRDHLTNNRDVNLLLNSSDAYKILSETADILEDFEIVTGEIKTGTEG